MMTNNGLAIVWRKGPMKGCSYIVKIVVLLSCCSSKAFYVQTPLLMKLVLL